MTASLVSASVGHDANQRIGHFRFCIFFVAIIDFQGYSTRLRDQPLAQRIHIVLKIRLGRVQLLLVGLCLAFGAPPSLAGELVWNGGFELNGGNKSSTFDSWNVKSFDSHSAGNFFAIQSGTTRLTPAEGGSGTLFPGPAVGSFSAVADEIAPHSSTILYQAFKVPFNSLSITVRFQMLFQGFATTSHGNGTLDYTSGGNKQFARVDILKSGANIFSTDARDVVGPSPLWDSTDGIDNGTPIQAYFNVRSLPFTLAPGDYVLRFAEVNNSKTLNIGVDDVSILSADGPSVPEPASLALMLLPCLGFVIFCWSKYRKSCCRT